jgi:hypothetical protein
MAMTSWADFVDNTELPLRFPLKAGFEIVVYLAD